MRPEHLDLLRLHTRPAPAPLVPELVLHQAAQVTPLWEATEALAGGVVPPPFWAFAWPGGCALARHILDHPIQAVGSRVIDLATGSGICALAARRAGAASVLAADIDPLSEAAVAVNAAANGLTVAWTGRDLLAQPPPDADLVLAGDIWYDRDIAGRVLTWLRSAAAAGSRVLVADPGRRYFPAAEFRLLGRYAVPTSTEIEDGPCKVTGVYELPD